MFLSLMLLPAYRAEISRAAAVNTILGFLLIVPLAVVSGCHSYSAKSFQFDTNITVDGYKLFQLTFPPRDTELRLPAEHVHDRNLNNLELSEPMVISILEQTMKANHYCREGFTLLGRYGGETTNRVRGECREKATDIDRKNHTNTIERW